MKKILLSALMSLGLVAMVASCDKSPQPIDVQSVKVEPETLEMTMGDAPVQLTATVKPSNADNTDVVWTVTAASTEGCVTVDEDGLVSAVSEGTATVVASAADGSNLSSGCKVTVKKATVDITEINIPEELTIEEGLDATLEFEILPENATNKTLEWSVVDAAPEGCVLVSQEGLVSGVMEGTAKVVATATDGSEVSASCAVVVEKAVILVSEITLGSELALVVNGTEQLSATVLPEDATNKDVVWSVENVAPEGCVTVDEAGLVTAVAVGTADVVATAADGSEVSASCAVTVNPILVTSIAIAPESVTLLVGATETLVATVAPENATFSTVTWSVKDGASDVCSVDENGLVSALAAGSAVVVATAGDNSGITAECTVTVEAPVYAVGDLYPNAENPIGVVFCIENDGVNGKVVALTDIADMSWGAADVDTGADQLNGLVNIASVQAADATFEAFPVFGAINELNAEGTTYAADSKGVWYLPAIKELRQLYAGMSGLVWVDGEGGGIVDGVVTDWGNGYSGMVSYSTPYEEKALYEANRADFNSIIKGAGGSEITYMNGNFWSSTQCYAGQAGYVYCFECYSATTISNSSKTDTSNLARLVMAF